MRMTLRDILHADRGATAIEYGMLAAGVALAAIVAVFALGGNLGALLGVSGDIVSGRSAPDDGQPNPLQTILQQTFADGREGWGGPAAPRTLDQIGTGLSLARESRTDDGSETVSRSFAIPAGATRAEISFDMSFVDSWDRELAKVYVNGAEIAVGQFHWTTGDAPGLTTTRVGGVTFDAELSGTVQAGSWGNPADGTDTTYRVTIAVDDPGEEVTLGFGTTLDQAQEDESLLIGNVEVRANP